MDRRDFLHTPLLLAADTPSRQRHKMSAPATTTPKQRLDDNLYLYVNADWGDDANNGWTQSLPKRTIQAAYDYAKASFDFNGHGMEIHLAATSAKYAPVKVVSMLQGFHIFNIVGDGPSPNSSIIQAPNGVHCVDVQDYAAVGLLNLGLIGGAESNGINCRQHTIVDYGNVSFWGMGGSHVLLTDNAIVSCIGNEFIYGGATCHWNVSSNSKMHMGGSLVVVNSPLAFVYFLLCQNNSSFDGAHSYTGAGAGNASSGTKYLVQLNAVAQLGGNTLPGNVAGIAQHGGVAL